MDKIKAYYLSDHPNKILLIERLPPDPYFLTSAKVKGGGSLRRSILNHQDLVATLSSMVKKPFEFHNVQLEKLSFKEQVDYFSKARLVLGQHGAGLANCVWMNPQSIVIEFSDNQSYDDFKIISNLKKHYYYWYKTPNDCAKIELNHFVGWLLSKKQLREFFAKIE